MITLVLRHRLWLRAEIQNGGHVARLIAFGSHPSRLFLWRFVRPSDSFQRLLSAFYGFIAGNRSGSFYKATACMIQYTHYDFDVTTTRTTLKLCVFSSCSARFRCLISISFIYIYRVPH